MSDAAVTVHVALALGQDEQAACLALLQPRGLDPVWLPTQEALLASLPECEYLLLGRPPRHDWSRAVRLQLLQIAGAGVDPLFPSHGLREEALVANCRGLHADGVRDHVMALILAFARDLPRAFAQQALKEWRPFARSSLAGRKMLLLGHGAIGARVAAAARGFGVRVSAVSRSRRPSPGLERVFGTDELEEAVRDADYFVIAVPLTSETRGLVGARVLAALPPRAFVVNVSRGAIVDEAALLAALSASRLAGAALDVFEAEPVPPASSLWDCPRLLMTPHTAGFEPEYLTKVFEFFAENVRRVRSGAPPESLVSRKLEY